MLRAVACALPQNLAGVGEGQACLRGPAPPQSNARKVVAEKKLVLAEQRMRKAVQEHNLLKAAVDEVRLPSCLELSRAAAAVRAQRGLASNIQCKR